MSLTTAFEFDKIVTSVLSVWSEDEGDEIAFMDVTSVSMPFPAAGTIWDIQSRWLQFSEVFTARRDAAWEDFEQEYVERSLLPAWVEEDDILMLPATAIVAAHAAAVAAPPNPDHPSAAHRQGLRRHGRPRVGDTALCGLGQRWRGANPVLGARHRRQWGLDGR